VTERSRGRRRVARPSRADVDGTLRGTDPLGAGRPFPNNLPHSVRRRHRPVPRPIRTHFALMRAPNARTRKLQFGRDFLKAEKGTRTPDLPLTRPQVLWAQAGVLNTLSSRAPRPPRARVSTRARRQHHSVEVVRRTGRRASVKDSESQARAVRYATIGVVEQPRVAPLTGSAIGAARRQAGGTGVPPPACKIINV
jgi:hypothetical protein